MKHDVLCRVCDKKIRTTYDIHEAYVGGTCEACVLKLTKKEAEEGNP